ncbi:MAG: hypothetical protein ACYDBB_27310 [Armatimonadota bacterium]
MVLTRNRRRWLILALIPLIFLTWWWFTRPKPLVLVARHLLASGAPNYFHYNVRVFDAGVVWTEQTKCSLHAVRWDGTPLWTLDTRAARFLKPWAQFDHGVFSPDLHTAVLTDRNPTGHVLRIFRDGRQLGAVPLPASLAASHQVDNAGGVWAVTHTQLLRIENTRLIARGPLPAGMYGESVQLSPDGGALVGAAPAGWAYCTMQVAGAMVQVRPAYSISSPGYLDLPYYRLLTRDVLLFSNGARYNARGQVAPPDGGKPYHLYLEGFQPTTSVLVRRHANAIRVLVPATGQYWTLPTDADVAAVIDDGRYALVSQRWLDDGPAMNILRPLCNRWQRLNTLCYRLMTSGSLALYECPGRLRARAASWSHDGFAYTLPGLPQRIPYLTVTLSPDGHTLYIAAQCKTGRTTTLEILTYRW